MNNKNHITQLRREVLVRLIRAFLSENFVKNADKIPYEIRPKNSEVSYRCCIHKERAVLRYREIAALGFTIENDDESKQISEYAEEAIERQKPEGEVLTIIDTACQSCVPSRVFVTDLCQGCVARPCVNTCPFDAITVKDGRSVINPEKCKNCMKCVSVCPYNAIVKLIVPCENACPVDAIRKNEVGVAEIDFDKCINCGACITACPFGAVAEKSQIIDILKSIKSGKKVVAMLAPSVVGQLPVKIGQIAQGLIEAGFDDVYEVAQGADVTAVKEAEEFSERIKENGKFMTTSCCASYKEFVEKHAPNIKPFVSETKTPMHYIAEYIKTQEPDTATVFVGPCTAKRKEGLIDENVDYVMSFEEMGALFVALHIELAKLSEYKFAAEASAQGRNFGVTSGVAESVRAASVNDGAVKPVCINGLDKKNIRDLKNWAKKGICPEGNLIEVMACPGGCVGGSSVLNDKKVTTKKVKEYSEASKDIK